jgi:hypothetical protein
VISSKSDDRFEVDVLPRSRPDEGGADRLGRTALKA